MAFFMDLAMLTRLSGCVLVLSACNPRLFDRLDDGRGDAAASDADKDGEPDDAGGSGASSGGMDAGPGDAGSSDASGAGGEGGSEDASMAEPACPPVHPKGHVFKIATVTSVGTLPVPEGVTNRAVGSSVRLDDRVVWTFPSGGLTDPENTGFLAAAHADPADPLELIDVVEDGFPRALLQLTPEEKDHALSLRSTSAIPHSRSEAWLFFQKLYIFKPDGVGVARLRLGADAHVERAGDLFSGDTDRFSVGGFADEGYVYLYGSRQGGVVRAPLERADQEASYEAFIEPDTWTSDLAQATPVLPGEGPDTFSVSPNRYLGGFLLVRSSLESNAIELFRSDQPQGPFEPLDRTVETEPSEVPDLFTLQAIEQVALREACGQRIFLSYLLPLEGMFIEELGGVVPTRSQTRLLSVELE